MERTSTSTGRWVSVTAAVIAVAVGLIGLAATPAYAQSDLFFVVDANGVERVSKTLERTPVATGTTPAPSQVAVSGDGQFTFVAYANSSVVSKLDASGAEVAKFDVGGTPAALAANQNGNVLWVLRAVGTAGELNASGEVVAFDQNGTPTTPVAVGESFGGIAVSSELAYVAAGDVTVINAAGDVVGQLALNSDPNLFNFAVSIVVNGSTVYLAVNTYNYAGFLGFSATGSVRVVTAVTGDIGTVTLTQQNEIPLFSIPDAMTLTANGHLYVGIPYIWADSLYGAGFLQSDWVADVDPRAGTIGWINLGLAGKVPGAVYSAGSLAAAPDGSRVFVAIPSGNSIAVIDALTGILALEQTIEVGRPTSLAALPGVAAVPTNLKLLAADDAAAGPVPAGGVRAAIANVLANDTLGGVPVTLNNNVEFVDGPSAGVTLDRTTGAVWVADGIDAGAQSFTYVIREKGNTSNTATGHVTLNVRERYPIAASGDIATSFAGAMAIGNVLANDTLKPGTVGTTLADVQIEIDQLDALGGGVTLDASTGAVVVDAAAAVGDHTIGYRICERDARNCSGSAPVVVSVVNRRITPGVDTVVAPRTGAAAILNVLANDTIEGAGRLALVAAVSDGAGVTIDANGFVSVAHGAASGSHTLAYQVCEAGRDNCGVGTAAVTVTPYVIAARSDSARLSPKNPATAIANVLANDTLGDMAATTANVRISAQYTVSPATDKIALNASTGAISILKNAVSGTFTLTYQVCEAADLTNCASGKATIDLSNGGGGGGGGGGKGQ